MGKNKIQAMRTMGAFKTLIEVGFANETEEIQEVVNDSVRTLNDYLITMAETLDKNTAALDDLQKFVLERRQ